MVSFLLLCVCVCVYGCVHFDKNDVCYCDIQIHVCVCVCVCSCVHSCCSSIVFTPGQVDTYPAVARECCVFISHLTTTAFLPASVMLPPRRLRQLLSQAVQLQVDRCPFHYIEQSTTDYSLLTDHMCSRCVIASDHVPCYLVELHGKGSSIVGHITKLVTLIGCQC